MTKFILPRRKFIAGLGALAAPLILPAPAKALLQVNNLSGFGGQRSGTLLQAIQNAGLTSGLKLCLDAGDLASYGGSGQSWLDRSGNGYDFFLGVDGSATATDPTFTGTAGKISDGEYWSFDGGDLFRYDTSNETWMQNIHKDGASYSIVGWIYWISGGQYGLCGTAGGNDSSVGFDAEITDSTGRPDFVVRNAGGAGVRALRAQAATVTANASAWNMWGVSVAETAGTGFHFMNGSAETFTSTYTSPSSSSASHTMEIAGRGNANGEPENASRMAMFAMWEGTSLTAAQMREIFEGTRQRFRI